MIFSCFIAINATAQSWQAKITPSVWDALKGQPTTEILVVLAEQGDLSTINPQATKEEKGQNGGHTEGCCRPFTGGNSA